MKKLYNTTVAILLALVFGIALRFGPDSLLLSTQGVCQKFGALFLNGLMMGVLPLILTSLILGAAKIALRNDAEEIAPRVLMVFGLNSFIAGTIASCVFFAFSGWLPHYPLSLNINMLETASFSNMLLNIFPRNIFKALASLDMIGLIVFFLFFGASLGKVSKNQKDFSFIHGVQIVFDSILTMIRSFMILLPLGVFALVLDAVLRFDFATIHSLTIYLAMFFIAIAGYLGVWIMLSSKMTGYSFGHITKHTRSALVSGFSTSSSAVSLPVALEALESTFSVNPDLSRFLMPLGITVNMAGTTLFVSLSSLYIAHLHGIEIDVAMQGYLLLLSWLTCLGTAGIPSGCLASLMIILSSIGIPSSAMGVLIGIDRFIDMIRTVLNLFGNIGCTLIIDKSEKERVPLFEQME